MNSLSLYIQMFIFISNFPFSQNSMNEWNTIHYIFLLGIRLNTPIDEKIFNVFPHLLKQDWELVPDVYFIVSRLSNIPWRILAYYTESNTTFYSHTQFVVLIEVLLGFIFERILYLSFISCFFRSHVWCKYMYLEVICESFSIFN